MMKMMTELMGIQMKQIMEAQSKAHEQSIGLIREMLGQNASNTNSNSNASNSASGNQSQGGSSNSSSSQGVNVSAMVTHVDSQNIDPKIKWDYLKGVVKGAALQKIQGL